MAPKKRTRNRQVEDLPLGAGQQNPEGGGVVVRVRTDRHGLRHAVVVPKAFERLDSEAFDAISELQHLAGAAQGIRDDIDRTVAEAREAGASWNAIGWSLGMTGQSAREHWLA